MTQVEDGPILLKFFPPGRRQLGGRGGLRSRDLNPDPSSATRAAASTPRFFRGPVSRRLCFCGRALLATALLPASVFAQVNPVGDPFHVDSLSTSSTLPGPDG